MRRLGARLVRPRHFEDNVLLDDEARSLSAQGKILRLRRTPAGAVVTYKGPRRVVEGVKARDEVEFSVPDPDGLMRVFEEVGLRPVLRYQKYRETYEHGDVELVVDETPIGTFLEVEGPLAAIHETASALGYGPQDYVADSYVALFFAAGGKGDMVFR
jgi:adenylate cyclase class 2